jgi:Fe-S cluster assembly iron-binding protein IscA
MNLLLIFFRREIMLEVTNMAVSKLKEYLEQNNISSAVRVSLMQGG